MFFCMVPLWIGHCHLYMEGPGRVTWNYYTLRNFKFPFNKICWSTGIKFTLAESFVKFCWIWNVDFWKYELLNTQLHTVRTDLDYSKYNKSFKFAIDIIILNRVSRRLIRSFFVFVASKIHAISLKRPLDCRNLTLHWNLENSGGEPTLFKTRYCENQVSCHF